MICADQIPDEVADAIRHCFHTRGAAKAEIAAAINAWPGMERIYRSEDEKLFTVILPVPQENKETDWGIPVGKEVL